MAIYGFTGTHFGMSQNQQDIVRHLLKTLRVTMLHHGDCRGADEQVHNIAVRMGIEIGIHPPLDNKLRAFCDYSLPNILYKPEPYLKRNRIIVSCGLDGVIATPRSYEEPKNKRGQGTWTTIGYAREAKRNLFIVFPDGWVKQEGADV